MQKTVLITGAAGFTGRHLAAYLASLAGRPRLLGIDRAGSAPDGLDQFSVIDLVDQAGIAGFLSQEKPDLVIHLAAVTPPCSDADLWHVNVGGTNTLIRALLQAGCTETRTLIIGSAAEYLASSTGCFDESHPVGGETHYGQTKWAQVQLAMALGEKFHLPVVAVRPFNLIGPGLPRRWVASELCSQFADPARETITVGNTASERDFVDVRDAVRAYWSAATAGRAGQVYNVCSGGPTRISELIDLLKELTGGRHRIEVDSTRFRTVDLDRVYGVNDRIKRELGWEPAISLKQSLKDMLTGFGHNGAD